jgi:cytochrome c oxidase subunit IV
MTCKFVIVVGYYMHLKFESRLLLGIFAGGMAVALAIILAMIAINANF